MELSHYLVNNNQPQVWLCKNYSQPSLKFCKPTARAGGLEQPRCFKTTISGFWDTVQHKFVILLLQLTFNLDTSFTHFRFAKRSQLRGQLSRYYHQTFQQSLNSFIVLINSELLIQTSIDQQIGIFHSHEPKA